MKKSLTNRILAVLMTFGILSGIFVSCSFDVSSSGSGNLGLLALVSGGGTESLGGGAASYTGPSSVPDVTITAPAAAGTIKMNGTVYTSIQAAFNAATGAGDYVITLTSGTYEENNLVYNGAGNIVISGVAGKSYGTDVLIKGKGDNTSSSTEKTRCALEFIGTSGNSLVLENLSIQNTFSRVGDTYGKTQAEALGFDSTGTCAAYNCSFLSHQDTIRTVGKAWFYGCYIEGDVDFIWMEKTGKVALYENCAIKTIGDEAESAYIAAPGMNSAEVFNKGLVVYNSAVKSDCADSYFFRNPWGVSETLYNIAAFVNVKVEGAFVAALQKSTASNYNLDSKGAIGWKVDQELSDAYSSKFSEIHTISVAVEKAEYNGRTRIINRVYKLNPEKYANDTSVWDVNALASARGWSVTADPSSLDSDSVSVLKANGTYNIAEYHTGATTQGTAIADGSSTDTYVSWSGLKYHSAGYGTYASGSNAEIKIQVSGASVISLVGSSYGSGTITMKDEAGNVYLNAYSTKMKTDKTALSFIYNRNSATTLTLTLTPTTYVGALTVSAWDGEQQKVTKVVVAGDDAVTVGDSINLSATVTTQYCAPESVTWSSSNANVATVTSSGVVTGVGEGEATITATSTFDSSKKASLKVVVTSVPTKKATWFTGSAFSAGGTSENSSWFTVDDAEFVWGSVATGTPSTAYGTVNTVAGCYYQNVVTAASENEIGSLSVKITAVKDIKITKISASFAESATGNISRSVKIGNGDAISIGTGKNVDFTRSGLGVEVASGSTVNIVFTTTATGSISGKTMKQLFKDITICCADNSAATPVSGTTYTWNFLGDNIAKYRANTAGGTFDTFLTAIISGGWQGDGYGYNVKTGDTFTVTVIGSVNVKVSSSYSGAGYAITTTGAGSLSASDTGAVGNGGSTLNAAYGEVNYTASSATEVCTITFSSKGQNYCNGVTVTPR